MPLQPANLLSKMEVAAAPEEGVVADVDATDTQEVTSQARGLGQTAAAEIQTHGLAHVLKTLAGIRQDGHVNFPMARLYALTAIVYIAGRQEYYPQVKALINMTYPIDRPDIAFNEIMASDVIANAQSLQDQEQVPAEIANAQPAPAFPPAPQQAQQHNIV